MTHAAQASSLFRDQRGAAMVMGVFFTMFLVGVAYYVVGIGDAIIHRQRMQDAADAGAFAAAVMHARGMNVIALINIMMSALLSVLVLLRLMEGLLTIAIAGLAIAAIFSAGGTSSLIPPLTRARSMVQQIENKAKPVVHHGLAALHKAGKAIRVLIPWAAQARVVDTVMAEYGDVASFGFALPMSLTLPVEPDDFGVLCGKAGEVVGQLALLPVQGIVPDFVEGVVKDGAESLTSSLQAYFCGGTNQPPKFKPPNKTVQLPKLQSRKDCEANQDQHAADQLCRTASIEEAQGMPDGLREADAGQSGECRQGPVDYAEPDGGLTAKTNLSLARAPSDCTKYEAWIDAAARQCNPFGSHSEYGELKNFVWLEAIQVDEFRYVNKPSGPTWEQVAPPDPGTEFLHSKLVRNEDKPDICNAADNWRENDKIVCVSPKPAWRWDCTGVTTLDGAAYPCPANGLFAPPPNHNVRFGSYVKRMRPVVRKLLGCEAEMEMDMMKLNVEQNGGVTNKANKRPFKLLDDAQLGEDVFQLRVVVLGKKVSDASLRGVKVALHGAPDTHADMLEKLRHLGRLSVAQAEYFTSEANGEKQKEAETRREWMWTPKWRARLRRIWIPAQFGQTEKTAGDQDLNMVKDQKVSLNIDEACNNAQGSEGAPAAAPGACDEGNGPDGSKLGDFVKKLSEIFIH
jgi:hypothetical protein